ncbi:MAG: hypothetical protein WBN40_08495 [Pseudomonadales bacterium]
MNAQAPCWDILINNALVFDGTGTSPQRIDIAIAAGTIAAKGVNLPASLAKQVIDGSEQYLVPGLLDIHTHLDLEVELEPGLPEAVRHGTTTVLVGNCSLGLSFGAQQKDGADPVVDCFARVENVPKKVLSKCVDAITWNDSKAYIEHFEQLPLGPNIAAFIPHSMLRVQVMGLQDSISREPTEAELQEMEALVSKGIDEGYMGISTDGLPFHYLANSPNTNVRIPTQHGSYGEYKRLLKVVRDRDRVWQTTAIIENKFNMFRYFALTSGLLHRKPLKTSALTAVEFPTFRRAVYIFLRYARLLNSKLFRGRIHFQALGTRFRIWSDGVISPLYEELPATCKLNAVELEDSETRHRMLNDADFIDEFRHDWYLGRRGFSLATLKAKLGMPDQNVVREPERMVFDGAPVSEWDGETFLQVMHRVQRYQHGYANAARSEAERAAFELFPDPLADDADFMLHLLREYDTGFRFYADVANDREEAILPLLLDENTLPGFNDSGAHLTNMAFFDANLMSLKRALQDSIETFATMVGRLTREPAEFFGLDTGTLEIGAQADITMLNPEALRRHDDLATRRVEYRDIFQHKQMLSRSDGVVSHVFINGTEVWSGTAPTAALGKQKLGRALRAQAS